MSQKKKSHTSPSHSLINVKTESELSKFTKKPPSDPVLGFEIPRQHRNNISSETETLLDSPNLTTKVDVPRAVYNETEKDSIMDGIH